MNEGLTWLPKQAFPQREFPFDETLLPKLYALWDHTRLAAAELWPAAPYGFLPEPNIRYWQDSPMVIAIGNDLQASQGSLARAHFGLYGSFEEKEEGEILSHFATVNANVVLADGERIRYLSVMGAECFSPSATSSLLLGLQASDEPAHEAAGIHWTGDTVTTVIDTDNTLHRLSLDVDRITPQFCRSLMGLILSGEMFREREYGHVHALLQSLESHDEV